MDLLSFIEKHMPFLQKPYELILKDIQKFVFSETGITIDRNGAQSLAEEYIKNKKENERTPKAS